MSTRSSDHRSDYISELMKRSRPQHPSGRSMTAARDPQDKAPPRFRLDSTFGDSILTPKSNLGSYTSGGYAASGNFGYFTANDSIPNNSGIQLDPLLNLALYMP